MLLIVVGAPLFFKQVLVCLRTRNHDFHNFQASMCKRLPHVCSAVPELPSGKGPACVSFWEGLICNSAFPRNALVRLPWDGLVLGLV